MGGGLLTRDNKASQDLGKTIIIAGAWTPHCCCGAEACRRVPAPTSADAARDAGLVLQSLFLFLFLWVTVTIHRKPEYKLRGVPDAELMFKGLYITTALLFVRSIFRSGGALGPVDGGKQRAQLGQETGSVCQSPWCCRTPGLTPCGAVCYYHLSAGWSSTRAARTRTC